MKNTGKQYESLVENVFVQLMEQDNVQNLIIEKNKVLQGKTTTHEIDVFWEFMIGGIKYSTIIQAKDWASKVPQGEMLKLKAILEDLPGQPRGIFVTKTGYQLGALDVATANGIILYELREPTERDWEGRIKTIVVNIKAYIPDIKVEIITDESWIQSELNRLNQSELSLRVSGMENEIYIKEEDGSNWKSIQDVKDEEQKKIGMQKVESKVIFIDMDRPRFLETDDSEFPRVKLKSLKVTLSTGVFEDTIEMDGSTMVGFILRNLIDDSEVILDKQAKLKNHT